MVYALSAEGTPTSCPDYNPCLQTLPLQRQTASHGSVTCVNESVRSLSCSIPLEVGVLAGRLTVALELLAQLLGAVQLQANIVLPLLRIVSQTLTVQGLEMLQVKAIGGPLIQASCFSHFVSSMQSDRESIPSLQGPTL